MLLDCHTLTMNTIVLQLSDAVADISMLQCSLYFVVDNATHALASSATARPTFNVEEEDVVIRNGWTPKEEEDVVNANFTYMSSTSFCCNLSLTHTDIFSILMVLHRRRAVDVSL